MSRKCFENVVSCQYSVWHQSGPYVLPLLRQVGLSVCFSELILSMFVIIFLALPQASVQLAQNEIYVNH